MNLATVEPILRALLYEGYVLYPYRASSIRNRQRWTLSALYPRIPGSPPGASEPSDYRTECIVRGTSETMFSAAMRFLQPIERRRIDGEERPWQEAVERSVELAPVSLEALCTVPSMRSECYAASEERDDAFVRRRETLSVEIRVSARVAMEGVFVVTTEIENLSEPSETDSTRDDTCLRAMVSPHVAMAVVRGTFESLLDPADDVRELALSCRNQGLWPVLVGEEGTRETLLASPIILYDYPRIAPESSGDLYDGTEIDEILTLRVLTLTDDEKREARATDPLAARILDRSEKLTDGDLARLHGAVRSLGNEESHTSYRPGDRVRLHPNRRADIFDIALDGLCATVVSATEDVDGRSYVSVTVDQDPGRDLGVSGKPGHRFFFEVSEVERLS